MTEGPDQRRCRYPAALYVALLLATAAIAPLSNTATGYDLDPATHYSDRGLQVRLRPVPTDPDEEPQPILA